MGSLGGGLRGIAVARPHLSAAMLLALPVLVYLWPALIGGELLAPISILYEFSPWTGVRPPDLLGYFNFNLTDVAMAVYPWRQYAREMIHSGQFPAWNPHVFTGVPFFSNPQNGLFSPFNLPLWTLPFHYAFGVVAALKLWAGAFGTYLLARQLKLGFLPGLLGGVAFAFSSLNIVWLTHETLPGVAVMLPWMVLFVERIFDRGRVGSAIGLAFMTAVAIGGGHPGMQLHVLAAVALYALLRMAFMGGATARERLRPLALAGGGLAMGVLLMAFMLIPELLSSRGTIGTAARQGGEGTLPGTTMPFDAIKTVLFPDWWGRPSDVELGPESLPPGLANYNERTFFAGVVALLLACVGMVAMRDWRRKAPFAVLGVLGLAIPLHAPGLWWLVTHLPAFELVQNQRVHFVFAFAVAVLAAFGLQAVLDRPEGERGRLAVPLVAVLVGLVALAAVDVEPGDVGDVVTHFVSGDDVETAGGLGYTSIAWFLLFSVATGAAVLGARRWSRQVAVVGAAVVVLAAGDALRFATGYQPMAPAERMIPPRTPAIDYLVEHRDEGRILGLGYTLINDWSMAYGLHDIRGYDPPYPTERYYELWRAANPEQLDWQTFTFDSLSVAAVKVASVLGARFVVTDPGAELPSAEEHPVYGELTRVYDGEDATIFRNEMAVPRVMVAAQVGVVDEEASARGAVLADEFDPRRMAVVEQGEPGVERLAGQSSGGTVRVVDESESSLTFHASLDQPGLVVISEQLTEGWGVHVDGREADVLRVNSVMRGVRLAAGEHEVEWTYAVPGWRAGLAVSIIALLVLLGVAAQEPIASRMRVRARRR